MKDVCEIYLVRHGLSQMGESGNIIFPDKDHLTEKGKSQAEILGNTLKKDGVVFDRAYSSDYLRAHETAEIVLEKTNGEKSGILKIDKRVRERFGEYEGLPIAPEEMVAQVIKELEKGKLSHQFDIEGTETCAKYIERQRSFLKELLETLQSGGKPQKVLILSHGLFINSFLIFLNDGTFKDLCKTVNWSKDCEGGIENTAVTKFTLENVMQNESKPSWKLTFDKILNADHLKNVD